MRFPASMLTPSGVRYLLCGFLLASSAPAGTGEPEVSYRLSMPEPSTHLFTVEILFPAPPSGSGDLDVALPVWRTGRYALFEFAAGVQDFHAADRAGTPLRWEKTDKSTWRVHGARSYPLRITYRVYANEFEQRTRGLDDEHAFIDGTAIFMYAPLLRRRPVRLAVVPWGDWHVTTGLDSAAENLFTAPDYDDFVDCPLEIGTQRDFAFMAEGKPHLLSLSGICSCDADTLIADIRRVIAMNKKFWGDLPYRRYVFLFRAGTRGGGATEHINSAAFSIQPTYDRHPAPCRGLTGLVSHEFFHTWNVKQFRPKGMDPYDWSKEYFFKELWIAEGSTSYGHGLLMTRNGFGTVSGYLDGIASTIQSDRRRPGNSVQSLTECSFDSWIKFNRPGPQSFNAETDFYGKGAAVSLLLDLEIRHRSGNARSFDDLLRTLYRRFPRGSGGYTVADVQTIAGELAGSDMRDFFDAYVHGTAPLPWERVLGYAGLEVRRLDSAATPWTGIEIPDDGDRSVIRRVIAGSPAYAAGLSPADEVVALEGLRVSGSQFRSRLADYAPGDTLHLTIFRNERLRNFSVVVAAQPVPRYQVVRADSATVDQKMLFDSWLGAGKIQ